MVSGVLCNCRPFTEQVIDYALPYHHFLTENRIIAWPDAEDDDVPADAKAIIEELLCNDPYYRLGGSFMGGVQGVKQHPFFDELDWETLLRQKAEFVPSLDGEEDTSYFDSESSGSIFLQSLIIVQLVFYDKKTVISLSPWPLLGPI